jgi:uncharacterized membrane protein YfcA
VSNTLLPLLIFLIATLYASAGFGGASGYLTGMSFFEIPVYVMASTALVLNILVSSIAFTSYTRRGHLRPRLLVPFLVTSVPAAFIGGYIHISEQTYYIVLYSVLTYLAIRMVFFRSPTETVGWSPHPLPLWVALISGAGIGLLSGMIGIGGGIFLSPLILLAQWGNSKQAAASAGGFIAINSMSGLIGRLANGTLSFGNFGLWLLPAGLLGALLGSWLGAGKLSSTGVRRTLGVVLSIAVCTYWIKFLL